MKYATIKFACGHVAEVEINGDASRAAYLALDVCPDCAAAKRKAEADALAAQAQANGLPALTGSEKQIVWAEQIRADKIATLKHTRQHQKEWIESRVAQGVAKMTVSEYLSLWDAAEKELLTSKYTARWWIDMRMESLGVEVVNIMRKIRDSNKAPDTTAAEALAKATVEPESCTQPASVDVSVQDGYVKLTYIKSDAFRAIVNGNHRYVWHSGDRCWRKRANGNNPADMAAEIANELLRAGFRVVIRDDEIRRKAVDADFVPECTRWITAVNDKLGITWDGRNNTLFAAAKKISGARYVDRQIVVPIELHDEVADFANLYGFRFSVKAQAAVDAYIASLPSPVVPGTPKAMPDAEDKLDAILSSDADVLADLVDD